MGKAHIAFGNFPGRLKMSKSTIDSGKQSSVIAS